MDEKNTQTPLSGSERNLRSNKKTTTIISKYRMSGNLIIGLEVRMWQVIISDSLPLL